MNNQKIASWLQIMANIGIVAGLLLVGVQLKQNSDLLKTQLLYEESDRLINIETQVVGENAAAVWAKSITDPKSLTLEEQRIMEAILWSFVEQLRATRMLADLGLLDNNEWHHRVNSDTAYYLANPYALAWWRNFSVGSETLQADLVAAVNARLEEADYAYTLSYMQAIMNLIDEK